MQQHGHHTSHDIVLEDGKNEKRRLSWKCDLYFCVLDVDPPFSPRIVTVKKNKLVTDEFELMEILGRYIKQ